MRVLLGILLFVFLTGAAAELPVVSVAYRPISAEYRLDGVVEAVNQATVSAQTSGRIIELPYDVDDYVEKGAVIVRFRDTEQRARYERHLAALREAEARHAEAEAEHARIKGVYEQGLISKAEMDKVRANFDAAKARLAAGRAALREAEEQLEQTVIRAPYSGIVVARHVQLGELATVGKPLMSGVSLESLRVLVDVPQSLIAVVRRQQSAYLVPPGGGHLSVASLRIYPYADAATHTFRVRANLPPGQHALYPGMLVKVIFAGEDQASLSIPATAIAQRGEVTAVYLRDAEGRLQFRQIKTGRLRDEHIEVLSGLKQDDQVVTDPVAAAVAYKKQTGQAPVQENP